MVLVRTEHCAEGVRLRRNMREPVRMACAALSSRWWLEELLENQ